MFETETEQMVEQRRSRLFLVLGGVGALTLAIVIVVLSKSTHPASPLVESKRLPGGTQIKLEGALRPGNPEFDDYKNKFTIEETEIYAAQNMVGMTAFTINSRITNRGDRTISGFELTAKALGLDGQTVIAQNTSSPIPIIRTAPLKPGEAVRITMKLDAPSTITEGDISNIVPELSGLIFQ